MIKSNMNKINIDELINVDEYIVNKDTNLFCLLESKEDINLNIKVDNANLILNIFSYKSKDININVCLDNKASIKLNTSIMSFNKQDININVNHVGSNTISDINNNASSYENGTVRFNVISKVPKGIKGCVVNQKSKIISNNEANDNEINPILLIDEYDVDAKHSAFIGTFNKDELFYLKTRGITDKDASNLLLNGLLVGTLDIEDCVKEELIKNYLL